MTEVVAGARHSCGLTVEGEAVCWGSDADGQSSPPPDVRFVSLVAGDRHTCGLDSELRVYCWGDDSAGQLLQGVMQTRWS